MKDLASEREALLLFIEKAERLRSSSFLRSLLDQGSKLTVSWTAERGETKVRHIRPSDDEVAAFVLTLRLFMQNGDRISVRNIARLYESLPVSAELGKNFAMHRERLNDVFEKRVPVKVNGDQPTKRELLDTVLYGDLAHLDEAKRIRYQEWTRDPMAKALIDFEFIGVLDFFLRTLLVMAEINRRALSEMQVTHDGPEGSPTI